MLCEKTEIKYSNKMSLLFMIFTLLLLLLFIILMFHFASKGFAIEINNRSEFSPLVAVFFIAVIGLFFVPRLRGAYYFFSGNPVMTLDHEGVHFHHLLKGSLNWEKLDAVSISTAWPGYDYLVLQTKTPTDIAKQSRKLFSYWNGLNLFRKTSNLKVMLELTALGVSRQDLLLAYKAYSEGRDFHVVDA